MATATAQSETPQTPEPPASRILLYDAESPPSDGPAVAKYQARPWLAWPWQDRPSPFVWRGWEVSRHLPSHAHWSTGFAEAAARGQTCV